ncbi:extracellular calcium-sensing receptor-like [Mixophyes fleayi]|uniref:extracellular calcium-sensing receptor-like n=1 Tax=Mixophyes fleayi TaxID=3061075 RepID=UPI003F4E3A9D
MTIWIRNGRESTELLSSVLGYPNFGLMSLLYKSFWYLILYYLLPEHSYSSGHSCNLDTQEMMGSSESGDLTIGVILTIHVEGIYPNMSFTQKPGPAICTKFRLDKYIRLLTIPYAVKEINSNPEILPNVTLGFHVYDSCRVIQRELDGTLRIITGQKKAIPNYQCRQREQLAAVIGHSSSTISIFMAHILGLTRYPQISHLSTSYLLSDKTQFPSFFRTVPSDTFQSRGLAQLVLHFGWTWVGMIADSDDYGLQGIQVIRQEILKSGACVEFLLYIKRNRPDRNIPHIIQTIKMSKAKAVIVFATDVDLIILFDELLKQNITEKTLVASEAWATSTILTPEKYWKLILGTVGFTFQSDFGPGFHEFIEHINLPRLTQEIRDLMISEDNLRCAFLEFHNFTFQIDRQGQNCTLEDKTENRVPFNNEISLRQISHYMKKVQVEMGNGIALSFDDNGDPPPVYDIVNWKLSPEGKVPISICNNNCSPGFRKAAKKGEPSCCYECVTCSQGEISNQTDSTECFKCPWNKWPSQEKDRCLPKTIDYLKYEEPLGITLTATSVISSFVPLAILGLLISYKATPVVRANNYTVSCLLLICLSLCFLCSLAFIGYPQREKCLLRQVAFGMIFSLCVSCILAKTIMVTIAFRATRPNSDLKKLAGPHVSRYVISLGTFLQFLICVTWLVLSPPFPEYSYKPTTGVLIFECNEGSTTAFWCTLGYLSVLALISFVVAFLARQLPDSYNEAKFITFSMIAFLSVWLSFIPAHVSTSGRYTVAMEIFAILSSSWAMLCCMFMPKCYIILFRPTVNSRNHLMRRFSNSK